jgi:hypothetical protein
MFLTKQEMSGAMNNAKAPLNQLEKALALQ